MSMEATGIGIKSSGTRRLPAGPDFTGFLLYDLCLFSGLFVFYSWARAKDLAVFSSSQEALSANLGAVNTIILLTSSWFVVGGIRAAKQEKGRGASNFFAAAITCGAVFLAIKVFEYAGKISVGISMTSNDFYMYYFVLTGFHGFHVLVGILLLAICRSKALRIPSCEAQVPFFEKCGTYWHVVDVIWIMLFPLLYLVR